jgi:hypothetical protein
MPIRCNIHPWMQGYLVLRSSPYMAVSDQDGRFELGNLPVEELEFRLWHERVGYLGALRLGSGSTDAKGRIRVSLESCARDWGEILVDPERFAKEDAE